MPINVCMNMAATIGYSPGAASMTVKHRICEQGRKKNPLRTPVVFNSFAPRNV